MTKRGKYIVIEGTDGTGKSTQVERLAEHLEHQGIETVQFHEPDGVEIASEIRTILKNGSLARSAFTNVLLFTASRRENWLQHGKPALERGAWVLSARDYTSTLVYQAHAEGLALSQTIEEDTALIEHLTLQATDEIYVRPDHTILLDIDDEKERAVRIAQRGALENPDTWDSKDALFQQKVIEGYRSIGRRRNLPIIRADQSIEHVCQQVWDIVKP